MRKFLPIIVCAIILLTSGPGSTEGFQEGALAGTIGESLISIFKPKEIKVKVRRRAPEVWIEASGCETSGVGIERIRLLAELYEDIGDEKISDDPSQLAQIIKNSVGEIILSEKDVNEYFRKSANPDGFSDLRFDFQKDGFTAKGKFKTKIIFEVELPLTADGILALRDNGVYLENTVIKIEGITQPQVVTEMILSKINPLLEFKAIPFPVMFTEITMNDTSAILTGSPKIFKEGSIWKWNKN